VDAGLVIDDGVAGPVVLVPAEGAAVMVVEVFAPTVAEVEPTTNVLISIDGNNKCPAFCGRSMIANFLISPSVAVKWPLRRPPISH
jgi:hypothetical protein